MSGIVLTERLGEICRITLNNPERRNCISEELSLGLQEALAEAGSDPGIKVVITTGVGNVWSAGMDVRWLERLMESDGRVAHDPYPLVRQVGRQLRELHKPTIAAINGYCLGAALTFLCCHDIVLAAEEGSQFGLPEVMRGFTPRFVIGALARTMQPKYLSELTLTGLNWDARKAQLAGLVSKVVPDAELQEAALAMANTIARWDPVTVYYSKRAVWECVEQPTWEQALDVSSYLHLEANVVNPRPLVGLKDFAAKGGVKADLKE